MSLSESYSLGAISSWAAPSEDLVFLVCLSRGAAACACITSCGGSVAISVRKKKLIYSFSASLYNGSKSRSILHYGRKKKDKIDKNSLIFVKIFVDVFQGITKSCQAPPFPPLPFPNVSIFG